MKFTLTLFLSFAMISCTYSKPSNESIKTAISEGNKIIIALVAYHEKNETYPENLEDLVPLYLTSIPETGLETDKKFGYSKIPEDIISDNIYGYRLDFYVSSMRMLGDREGERYLYQPSKIYTSNEYKTTIKIVDDWAYQEVRRVYQKR